MNTKNTVFRVLIVYFVLNDLSRTSFAANNIGNKILLKVAKIVPGPNYIIEAYEIILDVINLINDKKYKDDKELKKHFHEEKNHHRHVEDKLIKLSHQIEKQTDHIHKLTAKISKNFDQFNINVLHTIHNIKDSLDYINIQFNIFQKWKINNSTYNKFMKEHWAKKIIENDRNSILTALDQISNDITSISTDELLAETNFLQQLIRLLQDTKDLCAEDSVYGQIQNYLENITVGLVKGFFLVQYSYNYLDEIGVDNFSSAVNDTNQNFKYIMESLKNKAYPVLNNISREFFKCDPKNHEEGKTYVQFTQLLQGSIHNELELNVKGICTNKCSQYRNTRVHQIKTNIGRMQKKCNGKILNCKSIDEEVKVCLSHITSKRRYDTIEYSEGDFVGTRENICNKTFKISKSTKVNKIGTCQYCFCTCDQEGRFSDRYLNLRPCISNINKNYAITGIRFQKVNRVVHLQIQEGLLLAKGQINKETVNWKNLEKYDLNDHKIYAYQDYHIFNWENRAIDLDNITAETNHVITGVRFKKNGSHLKLQILSTPYNYITGIIGTLQSSKWLENSNDRSSNGIPLLDLHIPIKAGSQEFTEYSENYLEFTSTSYEKDAEQTTIPFIDTQNVEFIDPKPLSGVGLFYRGKEGYGGFIAPKIISYAP